MLEQECWSCRSCVHLLSLTSCCRYRLLVHGAGQSLEGLVSVSPLSLRRHDSGAIPPGSESACRKRSQQDSFSVSENPYARVRRTQHCSCSHQLCTLSGRTNAADGLNKQAWLVWGPHWQERLHKLSRWVISSSSALLVMLLPSDSHLNLAQLQQRRLLGRTPSTSGRSSTSR